MLQSHQPPLTATILTSLISEAAACPEEITLILDEYHLLEAQTINAALTFFLENLPPLFHLVTATREGPPLPLARLRALGQLTELRAADSRFSTSEAAESSNRVMGLNLSTEAIAAPETRTEVRMAGLRVGGYLHVGAGGQSRTPKFFHRQPPFCLGLPD